MGKDRVVLVGGEKATKLLSDFMLKSEIDAHLASYNERYNEALSGDLVFVVKPATDTPAPTAEAWEYPFTVELQNAEGDVHTWFNAEFTNGFTATDTSTAGTASMEDRDAVFVNGVAAGVLKGDEAAWLNAETALATLGEQTVLGYTVATKALTLTFTTPAE